jgi:CubicO group peptidase (beta-lactamase class C family)
MIFVSTCSLLISCYAHSDKDKPVHAGLINLPEYTLDETEKKHLSDQCAQWYDHVLKKSAFNGGILVAKHGVPVFECYKGLDNIQSGDSITAGTSFHIASVSKTFTAMAILLLQQQNKLHIDTSLSFYFPELNTPGITLRTLLNHRSGLPNYAYFMEDLGWNKKTTLTNLDILNALIHQKHKIKNIGRPNTYFSYSNTNFALLALVIEKVSGQSYAAFLKEQFFDPLNMQNTFVFSMQDSLHSGISYDYKGQPIPVNFLDEVYGDKNIYSTPRDLLQWSRGLQTGVLFDSATLTEAYTPYSNEKPGKKNYGLGWRMNIYPDSTKVIFHNGWWHGNNAVFIHSEAYDATIVVLGNRFTKNIYKAHQLTGIFIPSLPDNIFEIEAEGPGGSK